MRFSRVAAVAAVLFATAFGVARAQPAVEQALANWHTLCDQGDRRACVRFGMLLQEHRDQVNAWRRSHPDYFFYEH